MKIGLFTDSYLPQLDGVATSVHAQAKELEKLGHEVYIIAPKHPNYRDKKNVIRLFSFKLYEKPLVRVGLQLPQRSLLKILQLDFDIIHGHSGGPVTFLGWQIAHMKKIPYVATYHTMWNRYSHYLLKGAIRPRMLEISSVLFGNACDTLIAPTQKVRDALRSYGVKKPIVVIPSGLDVEKFAKPKRGYLRKKLDITNSDKIILSVCRLGKEKSVDFLIKSFKHVYETDPTAYLVLVGEGNERQQLTDLTIDLGINDRVKFTGGIPNERIPEVYADADLFLFASRTETQGLVILEAMISGLPVIAVADKAYKDIVKNDYNGYLLKKNVVLFAEHINKLLHEDTLRKQLGSNAHLTGKKFSAKETARELVKVYTDLQANYVAEKNSWRDVTSTINSDFAHLLQPKYRMARISVNIREMDRIMNFLKNRFIRS